MCSKVDRNNKSIKRKKRKKEREIGREGKDSFKPVVELQSILFKNCSWDCKAFWEY